LEVVKGKLLHISLEKLEENDGREAVFSKVERNFIIEEYPEDKIKREMREKSADY